MRARCVALLVSFDDASAARACEGRRSIHGTFSSFLGTSNVERDDDDIECHERARENEGKEDDAREARGVSLARGDDDARWTTRDDDVDDVDDDDDFCAS